MQAINEILPDLLNMRSQESGSDSSHRRKEKSPSSHSEEFARKAELKELKSQVEKVNSQLSNFVTKFQLPIMIEPKLEIYREKIQRLVEERTEEHSKAIRDLGSRLSSQADMLKDLHKAHKSDPILFVEKLKGFSSRLDGFGRQLDALSGLNGVQPRDEHRGRSRGKEDRWTAEIYDSFRKEGQPPTSHQRGSSEDYRKRLQVSEDKRYGDTYAASNSSAKISGVRGGGRQLRSTPEKKKSQQPPENGYESKSKRKASQGSEGSKREVAEPDDEVTILVDEDMFLLNRHGEYLLDDAGQRVKLNDQQIDRVNN